MFLKYFYLESEISSLFLKKKRVSKLSVTLTLKWCETISYIRTKCDRFKIFFYQRRRFSFIDWVFHSSNKEGTKHLYGNFLWL